MKKFYALQSILVISLVVVSAGQGLAQCTLDQNQPLTDGGTSERNLPGYYDGQTFTAGITGVLCEIDLMMFNTMTGTGILNVYSGSGISGALLTTENVTVVVPTGQVWQNWILTNPPSVTAGSTYTFQFVPIQGGGLPDPYGVNVKTGNVYTAGYDLTFQEFDLTFRTHVDGMATVIENEEANREVAIYPNPSNGKFAVRGSSTSAKLSVRNVVGQEVYRAIVEAHEVNTIDISGAPKGLYILSLDGEDFHHVVRIVVE
jgi:hypothetical protein